MTIEYYVNQISSALEEAERQATSQGISLKIEYQEGTPEYELQHELHSEISEAERVLILSQSRRATLSPIERQMALEILLRVANQVRENSDLHKNSLSRINDLPEPSSSRKVA